ncbi:mediator of RNA polymerase II transcription subunit 21-like [Chlorella sorokiniana]|uniref:Mediator of RNA polymerase II transcription subunit 21 n=1 Tax=Chlorella sorokiniana TaxID=3076 RepID=A0A2P6TMB1_CHLSO|nr:mediator of RNA polymerase II transcription subunit 21-like [Chlorella sorokiniana]|eukprot:PRW45474.1 mediator of RNA polymerase II transcription subunit 21-like [Chlorella sorokiniana]
MAAQPPPPPADLVSALQEQLGRVNAMLFNYIGALQRDAPPSSVKGEPLAAPPKAYDVQAQSELMAKDLSAALQEVEASIQRLPPMPASEAEEVAQAVDLMRQNAEASAELAAELEAARAKLAKLQDAHGVLAEAALCHRAAAAAAAAADKAAVAAAAGKGGV